MATIPSPAALAALASTPVDVPIPPAALSAALSSPPFAPSSSSPSSSSPTSSSSTSGYIPGALNLRDLGAYAPLRGVLRPRTVFRSGTLDYLAAPAPPHARRALLRSRLGVSRVVDFRRADEVKVEPLPLSPPGRRGVDGDGDGDGDGDDGGGSDGAGVTLLSCPYMDGREKPRQMGPADFVAREGVSLSAGYDVMYDAVLKGYTTGFRAVLEALRTAGEGDAVLFHCTAGKDRTGVMAALILDLMGAPADVIADEYALTRIGTEPWREKLLPLALRSFGVGAPTAAPDPRVVMGGGDADKDKRYSADEAAVAIEAPGMREMLGTYAAVMKRFVERLRSEYGGAEGYMKDHLGFSDADVAEIRNNLRPTE
ncbi:hypothetical protein JDV02_009634 [Purpureocillium takamizusanense]|uniref:Tyrosine specific protein phosphatases domain-containing protein n=1 Tax=Purpureocillium takamizusanense TaxID=2060973 RepID=A0A9Q8VEF3_9HYPO|nr:uncharacterized protein JDV02_009634 [Purpureocillium takamizusanense]UNI23840.1 hypothetical protein JDV02_009634 [Purpureocillium takamizusanense]